MMNISRRETLAMDKFGSCVTPSTDIERCTIVLYCVALMALTEASLVPCVKMS